MSATTAPAPLTRRELEAKIAKRALQDEAFRAEFSADPTAAFVKYAGVPAAQLPRIVVHEEQPGSWHIVLPAKPSGAGELSNEELEKIAGGTDVWIGTMIVITVLGTVVTTMGVAKTVEEEAW